MEMLFKRWLTLVLLAAMLQGCGAFRRGFVGTEDTMDPQGPVSLRPNNYALDNLPRSRGQIGLFELAYAAAYEDAKKFEMGQLTPPPSSTDPVSIRARRMAFEGVHLADAYCALFFRYGSDNQKWILVSRDIVTALGTIATGALALASPQNAVAAGVLALTTAGLYSGVDIYTRNFLFNSDNIEAVRTMTANALAAHAERALPQDDTSVWTFSGAAQVINDHQALCLPASIRSLVLVF